ncbi:MAG: EamA family transporter [Gammaproteobacteria bacterium]|nr:EamA family transporter [Gammaproteobacteria bacterium]
MQKSTSTSLPLLSLLLALGIAVVWGLNFVMVKVCLIQLPPLTLCAFRFLLTAIPAVFFVPKPKAPWRLIIGYGLITFAIQFGLLFMGVAAGVSPGVAALITQLQVFFAIFFACLLTRQPINRWQASGALISFLGVVVIAIHGEGSCTTVGLVLLLTAAVLWGLGNLISTQLKGVNMFSLVVWSSAIAAVPLMIAALLFEQSLPLFHHPEQFTWTTILALAYIVYAATYFGYTGWSWLISNYPVATIAPFALLCPIVALISSSMLLDESFESWKIISAILVMAGLSLNVFGQQVFNYFSSLMTPAMTSEEDII